jgi:predicted ABC-type transport system involved in lysophospholipase L1 biosynthesis ATPase subunit
MPEVIAPVVELVHLVREFAPVGQPPVSVLRGVSLTIAVGERLAILGPSGSGKSTLLNLIGGLDRPDSGSVRVAGHNLAELEDERLAELRNRKIGFVFQLHHLLPQCSVLENVLVPTLARRDRPDRAALRTRALDLLARVGLTERSQAFPGTLSGGERQRVAVARALINRPCLLLADEPTGSLDADSAAALGDLLAAVNREEGITLVVVTHSQELARRLDRSLRLHQGRLAPLASQPAAPLPTDTP